MIEEILFTVLLCYLLFVVVVLYDYNYVAFWMLLSKMCAWIGEGMNRRMSDASRACKLKANKHIRLKYVECARQVRKYSELDDEPQPSTSTAPDTKRRRLVPIKSGADSTTPDWIPARFRAGYYPWDTDSTPSHHFTESEEDDAVVEEQGNAAQDAEEVDAVEEVEDQGVVEVVVAEEDVDRVDDAEAHAQLPALEVRVDPELDMSVDSLEEGVDRGEGEEAESAAEDLDADSLEENRGGDEKEQ